jgi:4-diphosphocytidyl-2-C-methyl-D-erythritol kinase
VSDPTAIDCPAKINLFLEVHSRRPDGFHEIETVLVTIALFDTLHLSVADPGVETVVLGADLPTDDRNLVTKAAKLFLSRVAPDAGVRIRLEKRIPMMAGLGGGSSDAAGVLRGLRDLLKPGLADEDLLPLAAELGSDVPFFLRGGTAVARGRGELIAPAPPIASTWLVVCRPDFGLSTPAVYGRVEVPSEGDRRSAEPLLDAAASGAPLEPHLFNRLETAAALVDPEVAELPAALPGGPWMLTGSGSAFFTLAADVSAATTTAREINASGAAKAWALRTTA